ncbi:hypothetical protein PHISCL_02418 [Aspergillus sclerotialis]|uniref:Uncharacterized protein n=1 Tax=Aspergillus sclerotialis TaxID=2070753 RepID=A0A3A2ZQ31_9EURO|nr:hypothetical protein PHISCL_02418 [Aspergillus sclerotialis]
MQRLTQLPLSQLSPAIQITWALSNPPANQAQRNWDAAARRRATVERRRRVQQEKGKEGEM